MPNLLKTVPVEGKGTFSSDGKWSLLVESLLLSFSEIKTKIFVSVTGKGVPNICHYNIFIIQWLRHISLFAIFLLALETL